MNAREKMFLFGGKRKGVLSPHITCGLTAMVMPDPYLSQVVALGRGLSLGSVRPEELDNCEYPVSSNLSVGRGQPCGEHGYHEWIPCRLVQKP